jgi:DNA polymerase
MPPKSYRNPPKYAEGPKDAQVILVGQNPGREEVKQNRPFVGRAGKYLNKVLEQKGLDRKTLYLTCVVKKPTPGNRKPTIGEIRYWMPHLVQEIKEIKPQIVVLLGQVAWKTPRLEGIVYIETYHPAAAMRFPKIKRKFEKDMEELSKIMPE